ncbi:hypothetical protein [Bacillus swezeyi]|uniref:Uncharacterized protein n=1 Tax=Bacillus swezeyi TaxID=1925020 RepID=A0A5M8RFH6_9BACI|nr:hypothetical protein [Bacillus swezeyi]KAA6446959.1 hypothetical protein DX927_23205 [Bacillus swezeyi]KAA6471527.1 hypothetical protein DX928_23445 [Bacillus swezeyi]
MREKKVVLNKKERNKLFYSEITKDYPWFYELIKQKEKITKEDVTGLTEEQQRFIKDVLPNVLNQSIKEWKPDEIYVKVLEGNNRVKCSLCGTKNKNIYYITNKLSKKKINVGSDCVQQFGELGEWMRVNGKDLIKGQIRTQNQNKLNNEIPGIEDLIMQWDTIIDRQPIMLPLQLERSLKKLGAQAKIHYEEILENKKYDANKAALKRTLDQRQQKLREIESYVKNNEGSKFVVTNEILRDLKRSKKFDIIKMLQEDNGYIKWRTAHRITEKRYISLLVSEFNKKLKKYGIVIEKYEEEKKGFKLSVSSQRRIHLYSRHSEFTTEFGWLIFDSEVGEEISIPKLMGLCSLYDERSYSMAVSLFREFLENSYLDIKEYDIARDRIFLLGNSVYLQITLTEFIKKYKVYLFEIDQGAEIFRSKVTSYFESARNKITEKEFKRIKDIERSSKKLGYSR